MTCLCVIDNYFLKSSSLSKPKYCLEFGTDYKLFKKNNRVLEKNCEWKILEYGSEDNYFVKHLLFFE